MAASLSKLRDHTQTHHTCWDSSGRVISPTRIPLPDNTRHSQQTQIPPARFKPTIPVRKRPQTHALDRASSGVSKKKKKWNQKVFQFLCYFCPKQFSFKDELSEVAYVYVNVHSSSRKVHVIVVRF